MRTVLKTRAFWRVRVMAGVAVAAIAAGLVDARAQDESPSLVDLATGAEAPSERMLVEADSLVYDIDDETIAAVGRVVIYYGAYTLRADRVDVDRASSAVIASGGVEITDAAGNVARGERVELTDDLRDGVVEALEIVTGERTAFQAKRATRSGGDTTTFEDGVYLPCVDCDGVPGKKPIWQIRAQRIVHKQGEKTIVFQDATFEFAGVPIAWIPALSQPDPTVRRKSGVLAPKPSYNEELGFGLRVPYFYALAPNMDLTVTPGYYTGQGPYFDAEWRHRVDDGTYTLRIAGVHQNDPGEFENTSGDTEWRGSISSTGRFTINERWTWGWDLAAASDRSFFDDYDQPEGSEDIVNDVYLTGVDGRNRFESHLYGFFVSQEDSTEAKAPAQDLDLQEKQPAVDVIDHEVYAEDPILGGELSVRTNLTSLARTRTDVYEFDSDGDGLYGDDDIDGVGGTGDPEPTRLRAAAGSYTRASIDALWRRRFVDGIGQVFTPFAYFRGDLAFSDPTRDDLAIADSHAGGRAMPAVGLEYSYPILIRSAVGTQVIEPVAQLIVRPNEGEVGTFPNEDAQSLVFDATSLFDYDKFSGYDRIEGGTRLNVGLRYTGQFVGGLSVTGSLGQSIHLFGENPFATPNAFLTGADSGLEDTRSDYVAAVSVNTNQGLLLNAGARFDQADFSLERLEAQAVRMSGPFTAAVTYAFIRAQPDIGSYDDRMEVQASGNLRIDENWRLFGATRFDIANEQFVRNVLGLGYDSEAFSLSLSYSEDKARATGEAVDRTVYLRLGFRTLGDVATSADVLR